MISFGKNLVTHQVTYWLLLGELLVLTVYFECFRSDLCFHVVQNNVVLDAESALNEFDRKRDNSVDLRDVYARYEVTDVKVKQYRKIIPAISCLKISEMSSK